MSKRKIAPKNRSYHAWDWLKITEEEFKEKCNQAKGKCVICGRDTSSSNKSESLCQYHTAALTKWRKNSTPNIWNCDCWKDVG